MLECAPIQSGPAVSKSWVPCFCAAELAVSASGAIADGIQAMELEDYKRGLARSPQPTPAKRPCQAHPASNLGPHAQQQQQPAAAAAAAAGFVGGTALCQWQRQPGRWRQSAVRPQRRRRPRDGGGSFASPHPSPAIADTSVGISPASSMHGQLSFVALPAAFCFRKDRPWPPCRRTAARCPWRRPQARAAPRSRSRPPSPRQPASEPPAF